MSVKPVLKMGEPSLFEKSQAVPFTEFATQPLRNAIQDMQESMAATGGIGLAAPQIGHNVRIIIFGFNGSKRYPNEKPVPFTVLINPEIEILTTEIVEEWEGCLSVPGMRGKVPRFTKLKYAGYDAEGERIERVAENFHARMIQHECDHIDGVLFPMRVKDMKKFGYEDVLWDRIVNKKI